MKEAKSFWQFTNKFGLEGGLGEYHEQVTANP